MPSPAFLQHGPTQAYHRALVAASQPYPSPSWHSSPSTPWHTHPAASGSLIAATPTQAPASAQGCTPAAALSQLPATAPEKVPTTGPLKSSGAASELPHVSASELPHVSAKLAQQQAIPSSTQVPEAAALSQAVEVSEAASAPAVEADQDAGQPQLPAQLADSAQFKRFSIVKPVSSAAATKEPIRAFQPLGFPPAPASIPEQDNATTGAPALVQPQAGQQPQQLHDRPLVPKLQPRAVSLARQTSLAGSAEPSLQNADPAPVSNQLNAQPDVPSPALTSTGEALEQIPRPSMLASVQQRDNKPSSEQTVAEHPADAPAQELAQLLFLKRRELSQKLLQKLPQAHQQLHGRCQEQPQGLLQAHPLEHPLTQLHGQLHLSVQTQCMEGGKQPAADVAGYSAPLTPAFPVAGRQDSVKAEADTELLHSNSSQSAVQLSLLNMGASPSDQNITQAPDHKGQVATVSVFWTSCALACQLQ